MYTRALAHRLQPFRIWIEPSPPGFGRAGLVGVDLGRLELLTRAAASSFALVTLTWSASFGLFCSVMATFLLSISQTRECARVCRYQLLASGWLGVSNAHGHLQRT
jgi:hypothetical protein